MKRLSLAASLLVFGGISTFASGAHAIGDGDAIDVPFTASQGGRCTVTLIGDLLPVPVVPGSLVLSNSDTELSSVEGSGSSGLVGLICTQNFRADIVDANIQQIASTGTTSFDVLNAGFNGDVSDDDETGTIGLNLLTVDMTATTSGGDTIAAGDYSFIVPVTITAQ